jgi:hypothetical protein
MTVRARTAYAVKPDTSALKSAKQLDSERPCHRAMLPHRLFVEPLHRYSRRFE